MKSDVVKAPVRQRTVVRAERDAAKFWWLKPYAEVLAAAEAGAEGLRVDLQETDTAGYWKMDNQAGECTLIPCERDGSCELYQQGW